ncbi:MAG: hypothetical protein CFE32_10830 [Alphaproteobacteria bacterium PA3]|nr:MAG: hypothetical protein CFE32_10830 [Alphaproteobacteria bacterium PA3]
MPNSNEKLVAGIAALIPIAVDAFKGDHMDRQVDAILTNNKVRDIGARLASQTEKYLHDMLNSNKFTRQIATQFRPRQSPAPAILAGIAVVVATGFVFAYFERRKAPKQPQEKAKQNEKSSAKATDDAGDGFGIAAS